VISRIILFARYPEPGTTKTRLIPALGAEGAAALQSAMMAHTLAIIRDLCCDESFEYEVRFAGGDAERLTALYGTANYVPQSDGDLGERLDTAVREAYAQGVERVVVIGADCPELDATLLREAFKQLDETDVVLGPAWDGGYFLIGLRQHCLELFQGIEWGTEQVLKQTLERATAAGLTTRPVRRLPDVDYPEDLLSCRRAGITVPDVLPPREPGLLSIIIPTLNEEQALPDTLKPLSKLSKVELIIADSGSTDATISIAQDHGTRVVPTQPGRGRQMNAGAALARGETLLFLHADTQLPENFQQQIQTTLAEGAIAGAFLLKIDGNRFGLRCVEWGANLRSRWFQKPYGDQGLFLRAELFDRMEGFRHWPLMEDYDFVRRLREHGRIAITTGAALTSSRRWLKRGIIKTTLLNQLFILAFCLGLSPERLARWYR